MSLRVVVLDDYQDVARDLGRWDLLPDVELVRFTDHVGDVPQLARRLAGADVVVLMRERTAVGPDLLDLLPDLRLIVTTGMRNAALDVEAAHERGIAVSGTGGTLAGTAELTWGLILALARRIPDEHRSVATGGWQTGLGAELAGRTLGLLGLGNLGRRVARVGLAFDLDVIAWSPNLTADAARDCGVRRVEREQLFAESDVLSIHLVLSDRSRGSVGAAELSAMKPSALLVNTSRAPIVDTDALVDALRAGTIAGAALDVFDEEPLPAESALRSAPNLVLTPHIGYVTDQCYEVFYREIVEDIVAWTHGTPVRAL